jgi:hypothetical protein
MFDLDHSLNRVYYAHLSSHARRVMSSNCLFATLAASGHSLAAVARDSAGQREGGRGGGWLWRGLVVAERGTGRCDVGLGGATRDASRWDTNMVAGGARYQIQWVAAKARRVTWG